MPDNSNTVQITLQVKDDGTIVIIDQARKKTDELGETTASASQKGAGGLKQLKAGWLELAAGVTAGYFTIKKGLGIVTDLVNVAAEAEEIEKRLAFQTETWGYSFQKIKPYVDAFANSVQQTTRFSDEAARQGLGQMMQYTSSVEKGMQGVRLAMDFATQSHLDLQTAVRYVGMGMEGNVEPLGRYVLELRDLDKVLGENATAAEKGAYFFELFNKKFSGAAQKDLQTYEGQLADLKKQWDDLKESIGFALMPATELWMTGMQGFIKDIEVPGTLLNRLISGFKSLQGPDITLFPVAAFKMAYALLKDTTQELEEYEAANQAAREAAEEAARGAEKHAAALKAEKDAAEAASMRRDPDRWKKWVEEWDGVAYAMEQLGIKSTAVLTKEAADAVRYAEVVKKAFQGKKEYLRDYINALNAANEAMKKLTGEDVTDQLVKNEEEYQRRIAGIGPEDPERQKKVQAAIDDWLKVRKEIEKSAKIPVQADVSPMERQVQESIRKLEAQGITIPVTTSGGATTGAGGGGISWEDYVKGNTEFFQGGKKAVEDMNDTFQDFSEQWGQGLDVPISFYGIGSTRKPIIEKIQEIIAEFGGLEKALSGMEAEINLAELTSEYAKLERQLKSVNQYPIAISNMLSAGGNPGGWFGIDQTVAFREYREQVADLTNQMKILEMKMNYETLKTYGSYDTGTHYVARTGPYMLHEGEQVLPRNVSSNISLTVKNYGVNDPREIGEGIVKVIKYHLNTELTDLLKRR